MVLDVTIETPGDRPLIVVVDPDDDFPEENESDNEAFVRLPDDHTLDVEVLAAVARSRGDPPGRARSR